MKDTLITARRKKTELLTLALCFLIANLANLYAICAYDTPWSELFTSFFYLLAATAVLYVAWSMLRLLYWAVMRLLAKEKQ